MKEQPLFQNRHFGQQKTPDHDYEWNDMNIQVGIGDAVIDLSYTVLPKDETVIFIRNVMGKVTSHDPVRYRSKCPSFCIIRKRKNT